MRQTGTEKLMNRQAQKRPGDSYETLTHASGSNLEESRGNTQTHTTVRTGEESRFTEFIRLSRNEGGTKEGTGKEVIKIV